MHLQDVLDTTKARAISLDPDLSREVRSGFASDLMSDVLCYDVTQGLLITGLTNPQIIRTAEMADVAAILVVRGKVPPAETVKLADQVGIPILGTDLIMFEACGRLLAAGLPACKRYDNDRSLLPTP
jgi:predicted transcriptional regulator